MEGYLPDPKSQSVVSSTLLATVGVSSFLTMSENFQKASLPGTPNSLQQLSLPVVSNAAPPTGSACNFSRVSAQPVSSAWLLPSASGTSFQPLVASAYFNQHSSTTMLSGVSGQRQISTSAASCSGIFGWDITGSTEKKSCSLRDFSVTVIDQDMAVSSMPVSAQYDKISDKNIGDPRHPSMSASLVQGTSQIPNQGNALSVPYQEGSQTYYHNQGTLGTLLSGQLGPHLQTYDCVSYTGGRATASQQQMMMVLKEVETTKGLPTASVPRICHSMSAQPVTEANFQVMETYLRMETSLGLQLQSQTFCLSQTPEFSKSCSSRNIQILQSNPQSELEDISVRAPIKNSGNLLALPPAPSQEQTELDEIKTKLSKPLEAYQVTIENQDSPLLPIQIPDIHQLLACIDPLGQEEQSFSEKGNLGKNSMVLEDQGTFESGMESSSGLADIATLVEDVHLPQLFNSLKDLDQSKVPKAMKAKDTNTIKANQVQEKSSVIKGPSEQIRKNKHKASDPISGAPKAKIQPKNPECLLEEEVVVCNAAASDKALTAKTSNRKPQKTASSRNSITKGHGQEKTKRSRENNSKKPEESKQTGNKVKGEEKPTIPKRKRKKNQPEFIQESFKKPRSGLGMHMLEPGQVFHALGKETDKKRGLPTSQTLGHSNTTKHHRPPPANKPGLDTPREGKGPEKTQVKAQKAEGSAEKECSSPSQYERPPPGKVKLIPLPFLTIDKPPTRPVPRRPQSLASRRLSVAHHVRPVSTSSAQPTAVNPSRPTPVSASWAGSARPARPILTNPTRPGLNNSTRPSVRQSAVSRPAPYKTSSCTSFQRDPVPTAGTKLQSPPKPQNQFLLQDFASQPIPWRKPNVPEPVMSKPITEEQRPEREAMKRKAQQERENAAKYTSLGKVQFFVQREKDMEIADYYGYPI
ncbi:uncharacterized protein C2orf78-like [Choloepus didactylus]|uniref:uncharacterized protein C2orf78-like n=1 Tax=Choloepus didactylus TaxID=27675 RepID=UPI00189EC1E5|nr:uncharacterized protein C2orf78-like [Choloepus didactylus]